MRRHLLALTALAAVVGACTSGSTAAGNRPVAGATAPGSGPAAAALVPPPPNVAMRLPELPVRRLDPRLHTRLHALLAEADARIDGALGVSVTDRLGRVVIELHGDQPLIPASTEKLVTAAAALLVLGPDFRFETEVRATQPVGGDGTVHGDLVLVGGADPGLATAQHGSAYPERPRTSMEALADAVVAAGVKHVTGGVVGDPSVLADQPLADGWEDEYLSDLDTARVSGLTVDGGLVLTPRANGTLSAEPADDPAAVAAGALVRLLTERGVTVAGGPRSSRTPPAAPVHVGEVASPALVDHLRYLVQRSDNQLADGVFRSLGIGAGTPTWAGSAEVARDAVSALLGVEWQPGMLADGSGLSRANRVDARSLARLDGAMRRSAHGELWRQLLAVAGESGTLRSRLPGTLATGRLRAKTGTLDDVRALVGHVDGGDDRYHFAVLGNGMPGEQLWWVRALQDQIVLVLTEQLLGCTREVLPRPPPETPPTGPPPPVFVEPPPYAVHCTA